MPLSRCEDGICAVYPGLVSLDIVAGGLSGANGVDELLLDAGDVAVEDALGFGAEGYQNVFAELREGETPAVACRNNGLYMNVL